ncbi:MAG: twin-arginine translocase TatA/TatE family subunit [Candidatus Aminicenantes bacterium]|nr:twin-arginine translocase TatA/TatE family subunit [Candidatus Aminicenantes bacterium]
MFGSIGFPELIMIFVVVLLIFGPKKLPEFAKLLGKTIREFRSTVDEAKAAIESEIYKEGLTNPLNGIGKDIKDALDIRAAIDKPLKDIGKDVKDAIDGAITSARPAAEAAAEDAKNAKDEKSE